MAAIITANTAKIPIIIPVFMVRNKRDFWLIKLAKVCKKSFFKLFFEDVFGSFPVENKGFTLQFGRFRACHECTFLCTLTFLPSLQDSYLDQVCRICNLPSVSQIQPSLPLPFEQQPYYNLQLHLSLP